MSSSARSTALRSAARTLHAKGFNVTAIAAGGKEPAHRWNDPTAPWTTVRQPPDVVDSLGHGWSVRRRVYNGQVFPPIERIGLICGIGDLRCIDIDAIKTGSAPVPVPDHVFVTLLDQLGVPQDYPWAGRSSSGSGWHILFRCPDPLPDQRSIQRYVPRPADAPPAFAHIELRWHTCQVALPTCNGRVGYRPAMLDSEPATLSLAQVHAALAHLAVPAHGPTDHGRSHAPFGDGTFDAGVAHDLATEPPDGLAAAPCLPPSVASAMERLRQAMPGHRNTALNAAAYLAGRAAAIGQAPHALRTALIRLAMERGLPATEAVATANSGWQAGLRDGARTDGSSDGGRWSQLGRRSSADPAAESPASITVVWQDAIDDLAPPTPLIYGMLNVGGVALLVGPSESGKSTVAVHLACTVAQYYPVLYVAAESAGLIRNQIRAWERTHHQRRGRIGVVPHPVMLADAGQVDALCAAALAAHVRLIVIDTLSACIPGLDENDPAMSGIVATLNRLAQTASAAVIVLHHPPKSNSSPYRGHSSLYNNTDTTLTLERPPDAPDAVRITAVRHKGMRRAPLLLAMERCVLHDDPWYDPHHGPPTAPVVRPMTDRTKPLDRPSKLQRDLMAMIASVQSDGGVSAHDLARWMGRLGYAEATIRQQLAHMAQRGWITPAESPLVQRRLTLEGQRALETPDPDDPTPDPSSAVEINLFLDAMLQRRTSAESTSAAPPTAVNATPDAADPPAAQGSVAPPNHGHPAQSAEAAPWSMASPVPHADHPGPGIVQENLTAGTVGAQCPAMPITPEVWHDC